MSEAPRREFDAWCETEFGMTRKLRIGFAIMQEMFRREVSSERREKVLSCDTMAWAGTLAVKKTMR
jgi:hypothetical protein